MSPLYTWATRWGVSLAAVQDLQRELGLATPVPQTESGPARSEAWVQSVVRLEASNKGLHLWRNNVGALTDKGGRLVRFGLANDSKELNATLKSGDLVGWRPVTITPQMVGLRIAQFVSRECKEPGWQYTATEREVAQLNWANLVNAAGGDARFVTAEGSL
jgi:hypothetical protein